MTRGALYHQFRDKRDLFRAVFACIEEELAAKVAAAASVHDDAWDQLRAGCTAFFEACADPALLRLVLFDAPAVLGWETWRAMEAEPGLRQLQIGLERAVRAGYLAPQPIKPLAHLLLSAIDETAMMSARAEELGVTRADAVASFGRLLEGLRVDDRS